MKLRKRLPYLALSLLLVGCNAQVSDYVSAVQRQPDSVAGPKPSTSTSSPMGFKITPGKIKTTTTGSGALEATVTPTNKVLALGPDMAISVTINRARTNPQ